MVRAHRDTWRQFTGDQLGVIFGVTLFRQYKAAGKPIGACMRMCGGATYWSNAVLPPLLRQARHAGLDGLIQDAGNRCKEGRLSVQRNADWLQVGWKVNSASHAESDAGHAPFRWLGNEAQKLEKEGYSVAL